MSIAIAVNITMKLLEIHDRPVSHVDLAPIRAMFTKNLLGLIDALEHYGFQVRIIGGAVRDLLRHKQPRDIDLACDAFPDEVIYVLRKHGYNSDLKGLQHGTVKVVFDSGEEYEITALDFMIRDRNDKLHMTMGRDWRQDALRRDFTINAMSVDLKGNLYDYVGGLADLKDQHIRFIGDYADKIPDDPVLILRFFKLISSFPDPQFDKSLIVYIQQHHDLVCQVKPKRVRRELENIAAGPNSERVMALMRQLGLGHCLEGEKITEHSWARAGDKPEELWSQVNHADFADWLCTNILRDPAEQEQARRNPKAFSQYLPKYFVQRIQYVAPANYGLML